MRKTFLRFAMFAAIAAIPATVMISCGDDKDEPKKEQTDPTDPDNPADPDNPTVINVTDISLDSTALTLIISESYTLKATVKPANATNKTVIWTSSDKSKATVDSTGKVTAISVGTATITAKAGNKTATSQISVIPVPIPVTSISLNKNTFVIWAGGGGLGSEYLNTTLLPSNATNKTVTWTSSDNSIATVSSSGEVEAVAPGTVIITAKAGEQTATCEVQVKNYAIDDPGAVVNGVKWATRNVGTPGTFERDSHYYYTWADAQNACPANWRLPSKEELQSLVDAGTTIPVDNISSFPTQLICDLGVGRIFGDAVLLPFRGFTNGTVNNPSNVTECGVGGYYWSSTQFDTANAYRLGFGYSSSSVNINYRSVNNGYLVRCVAE